MPRAGGGCGYCSAQSRWSQTRSNTAPKLTPNQATRRPGRMPLGQRKASIAPPNRHILLTTSTDFDPSSNRQIDRSGAVKMAIWKSQGLQVSYLCSRCQRWGRPLMVASYYATATQRAMTVSVYNTSDGEDTYIRP